MNHSEFEALIADAACHLNAGHIGPAKQAITSALRLRPNHPGALHNLGVIEATAGHMAEALAAFDRALAAQGNYPAAHFHRAMTLKSMRRLREARDAFACACATDPEFYSAHHELALCHLALGERGPALDHLGHTYELRRGDSRIGIAERSLTFATALKLLHDAQQFRHIAQAGRDPGRFVALAKQYEAIAPSLPPGGRNLTATELQTLGGSYNTSIRHVDAPELPEGVLTDNASASYRRESVAGKPPVMLVIDDLLRPKALASLRNFLVGSTIWHDFTHIPGFVASYLEDGLACPLLLQVSDELHDALPSPLADYPLTQAWAFKAVEPRAGIAAHSDDASYSINFWVTPNAANLQPETGGLKICLEPPPQEWSIGDYASDISRAVPFLEQNRDRIVTVPYRENRAVLFKSRLLHSSDMPVFDDSYENRRINITMLFDG